MIEVMRIANWSLFFVALVACGVAGVWVGFVALGLVRRALEIERGLSPLIDGIAARADTAMQHSESAAEHLVEIETAALRLEESVDRLAVLVGAFSEANRRWKRFTGFVR